MLYGAYGYTGRLVADVALARGERPVLAGRDGKALGQMAAKLGLEHRVVGLDDPDALAGALDGIDAVAHCAGPFSATAAPMVEACLAGRTHYLDITGEIDVFEAILARGEEAAGAGVVLLPGAGFDVVPSDCLAGLLARALPTANRLELALRMDGGVSPGTAMTAMEALGAADRCRVGGQIEPVPTDRRRRQVKFADGKATVTAISWGDVSTAFHTTGIPDIVVYAALPLTAQLVSSVAGMSGSKGQRSVVQRALRSVAGRLPGPSAKIRARSPGQLWGRAIDPSGAKVTGTVTTPNGYDLTADSVVRVVQRLAAGSVPTGAHTPSRALGADFVRELDDVTVVDPA
jgi:saccharopine dehydrogenase (NAD+, L-lysine-forming)